MHPKEDKGASPPPSRRSAWLFSPRTSMSRSLSPPEFEVNELLSVRTMHSFTRRMKSFNKDRNPDLLTTLPSYMRQTCASLVKRPRSGDHSRSRTTSPHRTGRATSVECERQGRPKRSSRRTQSSLSEMRGIGYAPNDKLGFLLEEMPEGFDWSYDSGMLESGGSGMMIEGNERRSPSKQNLHRRSQSGKVKEVKTVKAVQKRRSKSRSEGSELLTGSSSRALSQSQTRSPAAPSDRKSDAANNTSPGKVEDLDFMTVQIGVDRVLNSEARPEERCPRPKSTLPLKEMDVAAQNNGKRTPNRASKNSSTSKSEGSEGGRSRSQSPYVLKEEREAPDVGTSKMYETDEDSGTEEYHSVEDSEPRDEGPSIGAFERGFEVVDDMKKEEGVLIEEWGSAQPITNTEEILSIMKDEAAAAEQKITSQDLTESFNDAVSRSCHSSQDLAVEGGNDQPAVTVRSRKSFLKNRKVERPSNAEETTKRRKLKGPKFLRTISDRLSLAARSRCCRFSFKACFCGADVSPGPVDDDLTENLGE